MWRKARSRKVLSGREEKRIWEFECCYDPRWTPPTKWGKWRYLKTYWMEFGGDAYMG